MTSFKTSSEVWTTRELLVNSFSSNPYIKSGKDFLGRNYGYSTDFDGGSLWIFDGTSLD